MSDHKNDLGGLRVAVIGAGIFGAMTALRLAEKGAKVAIFDMKSDLLMGASFNNQNRLHLGFHYPRDLDTAKQCIKGFYSFKKEFGECILENFDNLYFVANKNSFTSPSNYLDFCEQLNLDYEVLNLNNLSPRVCNVDVAIKTQEVVYDCAILREVLSDRLMRKQVNLHLGEGIKELSKAGDNYYLSTATRANLEYDVVINATYANINKFNAQLGYPCLDYQFEYTMIPIIEWDQSSVGLTIMDGPFMTVLPFGKTGNYLMYHVDHTVVSRQIGKYLPELWLSNDQSPAAAVDKNKLFQTMQLACSEFVPDIMSAKLLGFLQGPRMVLSRKDSTDARPSIIDQLDKNYFSVFSGKIDHCMWVADEIVNLIAIT